MQYVVGPPPTTTTTATLAQMEVEWDFGAQREYRRQTWDCNDRVTPKSTMYDGYVMECDFMIYFTLPDNVHGKFNHINKKRLIDSTKTINDANQPVDIELSFDNLGPDMGPDMPNYDEIICPGMKQVILQNRYWCHRNEQDYVNTINAHQLTNSAPITFKSWVEDMYDINNQRSNPRWAWQTREKYALTYLYRIPWPGISNEIVETNSELTSVIETNTLDNCYKKDVWRVLINTVKTHCAKLVASFCKKEMDTNWLTEEAKRNLHDNNWWDTQFVFDDTDDSIKGTQLVDILYESVGMTNTTRSQLKF